MLRILMLYQPAHRRAGGRGNLDQVHILLARHAQGILQTDDPQGLVIGSAQADFRGHDFPVQAVLAFLALAAVAKISSDGLLSSSKKLFHQQRNRRGTRRQERDVASEISLCFRCPSRCVR
jgi:hypothetical protein